MIQTSRIEEHIARSHHVKFEQKRTMFGLPSYRRFKNPNISFVSLLKTLSPMFFFLLPDTAKKTTLTFVFLFFLISNYELSPLVQPTNGGPNMFIF